MKKIILLMAAFALATVFTSCKKDDDNNSGNNNNPATTCVLKSIKEVISTSGNPDRFGGFALYYTGTNISRANFYDSVSGNEDSTSYALFSYNGSNLTDVKLYQQGQLVINFSNAYNSSNLVSQKDFSVPTPFGAATITQKYFYDANGRITYSLRTTTIDNVPQIGKLVTKDSALYSNYNAKGRVGSIIVYNSVTTQQGTQPYEFDEEIAYEYDANGNRTKESGKSDVADPFEVTRTAMFDMTKTPGAAEKAYRTINVLNGDWADPNINGKDIDPNLMTSETEFDGSGNSETTITTYTFNDKGNPATTKAVTPTQTTNTTLTYDCK